MKLAHFLPSRRIALLLTHTCATISFYYSNKCSILCRSICKVSLNVMSVLGRRIQIQIAPLAVQHLRSSEKLVLLPPNELTDKINSKKILINSDQWTFRKLISYFQSQSFDVLLEEDPAALVEALETIAAEQPLVARSIPKHAKITKREDRSMRNCLFEQEVGEQLCYSAQ